MLTNHFSHGQNLKRSNLKEEAEGGGGGVMTGRCDLAALAELSAYGLVLVRDQRQGTGLG